LKRLLTVVVSIAALAALAGCGSSGTKTVTTKQPAATSTPTTTQPTTTNQSMGTVPQNMSSGGTFDAQDPAIQRQVEADADTAASNNGLTHVVTHCSADSSTQLTCSVRGTRPDGTQGNETDTIGIDPQTGHETLINQTAG
jgi:predicted small lipoprotein YifL